MVSCFSGEEEEKWWKTATCETFFSVKRQIFEREKLVAETEIPFDLEPGSERDLQLSK